MKRTKKNEGVALIVVLGFLSLMLVLAVAFLSEARTERVVSDYSLEAIRARQLMRTALAAAMNDYSREMWAAQQYGLPEPGGDFDVFVSEASENDGIPGGKGTLRGSGVVITNGEVRDWIPARFITSKKIHVDQEMEDAEWILVRETPGSASRILGRYAYICLDSSGGLDANWVAREDEVANRDSRSITNLERHSIREVPMGLLPEVADASQFKSYRRGWKGFDSLQMLAKLTDGVPNDGTDSASNTRWQSERTEYKGSVGLISNLVSDLVSYSLTAYRGGRYAAGLGSWEKPIFMDQWANPIRYIDTETGQPPKDEAGGGILKGLKTFLNPFMPNKDPRTKPQLTESDLETVNKQLQDYLSSRRAPLGVDYPSIKAVPMFNEMWVKGMKLNAPIEQPVDGTNQLVYTAEATVGFETWFPFPSEDDKVGWGTYRIDAPTVTMQSSAGSGIWIPVALQLSSGSIQQVTQIDCQPDKKYEEFVVSDKPTIENLYLDPKKAAEFTYKIKFKTTKPVTDRNAKLMWRVGWTAQDAIELKDSNGTIVDRIAQGVKFQTSTRVFEQGKPSGAFSMEVTDPRLNHLSAQWQKADSDEGSVGEINDVTKGMEDFKREGRWMYCRNGKMKSVAEFGYFPLEQPWKTINLCTYEGAKFLALATVNRCLTNDLPSQGVHYTNATININTQRTNVLASAFYELSFMPTPNTKPSNIDRVKESTIFSDKQALMIAERIQAETVVHPYQSGMDWAASAMMTNYMGYLEKQGLTQTEKESLLRNTDGLFSVSDSLFTVILVAQSIKEGPGNVGKWDDEDQVTGERRAVALVWRDPFKTGNNQHHEMMVRMFRFLND